VRYADAVVDGDVVRGTVTDDANAAYAQERRAAVFRGVETAAKVVKGAARQKRAHLRGDVLFNEVRSTSRTKRPMPSLVLSATLPTKPSQTITSALPLKMSRPSTLPMKLMAGP